jgi:hypothetical protein
MKRTLILAILLILTAACAHQQAADKPQTAPPVTETAHSTNTEPMQVVGGGGIDVKLETTPALPAEATEISSDPLVKWAKGLRDKLASPADRQAAHTIANDPNGAVGPDKVYEQCSTWVESPATEQQMDELLHAVDVLQPLALSPPPTPVVGPLSEYVKLRRDRRALEAGIGAFRAAAFEIKLAELRAKRMHFREDAKLNCAALLTDERDFLLRAVAFAKTLGF